MEYSEIYSLSRGRIDLASHVEGVRRELMTPAGGNETDEAVTRTDVYQDFDSLRRKVGIEEWAAKFVTRKYAFEDKAVEKGESEWMKVVYGFDREWSISFKADFS